MIQRYILMAIILIGIFSACTEPWEILEHDKSFISDNIRTSKILITPLIELEQEKNIQTTPATFDSVYIKIFSKVYTPSRLYVLSEPCNEYIREKTLNTRYEEYHTRYLFCPVNLKITGKKGSYHLNLHSRVWDTTLRRLVWESFTTGKGQTIEDGMNDVCGQFIRSLPGHLALGRPGAITQ